DLATIGFFVLVGVVYSLKFVWAPFIDRVTLPAPLGQLGRRRGWAILTQAGLIVSIILLGSGDPAASPAYMAFCAVLVAFCSASQDIVIDAYRVELLDDDQQGAGAATTQIGYRFGMIASGWLALRIVDDVGWFAVYLLMASFVLVGVATILMTREPVARSTPRVGSAAVQSAWMRFAAFLLVCATRLVPYLFLPEV